MEYPDYSDEDLVHWICPACGMVLEAFMESTLILLRTAHNNSLHSYRPSSETGSVVITHKPGNLTVEDKKWLKEILVKY
jgi:hypothetical protein